MNGKLAIFNTVLGMLCVVLFGFLIANVHRNVVRTVKIETALRHCECANIEAK